MIICWGNFPRCTGEHQRKTQPRDQRKSLTIPELNQRELTDNLGSSKMVDHHCPKGDRGLIYRATSNTDGL